MKFRTATIADLNAICEIENICFPPNEAASKDTFSKRLLAFPSHFWLLELDGELIGFVNGMASFSRTIADEMFSDTTIHNEQGSWQSIFGLAVAPAFRSHGYASMLLKHLIENAKQQGRAGVTLTCKSSLIPYYQKFGFVDQGISASVHGGEVWHDMTLDL